MKKRFIALIMVLATALALGSCADKDDIHSGDIYGKGDYIYDTVIFTGTGLGKEKIMSVKDLEALCEDDKLAYEGKYSMMTRGAIFSCQEKKGLKLYQLLLKLGMNKDTADDTEITICSRDGYTTETTVGQIKNEKYYAYDSKDASKAIDRVPVILAFSSEGVPLVGPTGAEGFEKKFTAAEGYSEKADNSGGPVRLIIGQNDPGDYNAPKNAKWVSRIIIGDEREYNFHSGRDGARTAVEVVVIKDGQKRKEKIAFSELEQWAAESKDRIVENYYGRSDWFCGVDFWKFLKEKCGIADQEGRVNFDYQDGSRESVDMAYLRNISGDYSSYVTEKEGKKITGVVPALGYGVNGKPSQGDGAYVLLPADGRYKKNSTVEKCIRIVIYEGEGYKSENKYKNASVSVEGEGLKKVGSITVGQMEEDADAGVIKGDYRGVSLYTLLRQRGLTADADKVVLSNGKNTVTWDLSELEKAGESAVLAVRKQGEAIEKDGPVMLVGKYRLYNVKSIRVSVKKGNWIHDTPGYKKYLQETITVTGPEATAKKTYTIKELEHLSKGYTVRDTYAAGGQIGTYQGVILRKLIADNLKKGVDKPSKITITGKDGYDREISVNDVYKGIDSKYQTGEKRDMILAYSRNGMPLVPGENSSGYKDGNSCGPLRLIVENQISQWVKDVREIKLGEGNEKE